MLLIIGLFSGIQYVHLHDKLYPVYLCCHTINFNIGFISIEDSNAVSCSLEFI